MEELYIGIMSGTSIDGVDALVADFSDIQSPRLLGTLHLDFDDELRQSIQNLFEPNHNEIDRLGQIDKQLASCYAHAVNSLLAKLNLSHDRIKAIGNHGQTIRHRPNAPHPFTLQIGDAGVLSEQTGIPVISDFRRNDMAVGGQGAPLAPGFHQSVFSHPNVNRCIINIGGIANVTNLPITGPVMGWDTGPGNGLMDAWIQKHQNLPFDAFGRWAALGKINENLLSQLLSNPYFARQAPKSTGKEEFTLSWLLPLAQEIPAQDVQRTLLELTCQTIANAINDGKTQEAYLCGGGAKNDFLVSRLTTLCPEIEIATTTQLGIDPNWVEAIAFAWLARQYCHRLPGNIPSVTGARRPAVLGSMTFP